MTIMGRGFRRHSTRNKCFQGAVHGGVWNVGQAGTEPEQCRALPERAAGSERGPSLPPVKLNKKNPALRAGFLHLREIK